MSGRIIFDTVSGGRIGLSDSNMMLYGAIGTLAQRDDDLGCGEPSLWKVMSLATSSVQGLAPLFR